MTNSTKDPWDGDLEEAQSHYRGAVPREDIEESESFFQRHSELKVHQPGVRRIWHSATVPSNTDMVTKSAPTQPEGSTLAMLDGSYAILNIPAVNVPCMEGVRDVEVMVPYSLAEGSDAKLLEKGITIVGGVTIHKGNNMYNSTALSKRLDNLPVIGKETLDFIVAHATP